MPHLHGRHVCGLFGKLSRRLARERGFALIPTIGVSLVLGIAGTTSMTYTVMNEGSSATSKADRQALSLAEAGLAYAYSTLYSASDPTQPGAVPLRTEGLEGGTITWSGTLDVETDVWTLVGTGRVPSPVRSEDVIQTVRGRVLLGTGSVGSANNAIWNYVYAEAPTSCTTLQNSVNINVPFYVKGSLCLNNSSQVSGPNTVLQVGGSVTINNSAHVGEAGAKISEARIGGGCRLGNGPLESPCSSEQMVFANAVHTTTTSLEKPPVDLAGWYENAKPGPKQNCSTGSFPGGFDNDSTLNRSLPAVNLTPSLSYDCTVVDAQGAVIGRIAWKPSTKELTIAGTIFFDGDIVFQTSTEAYYSGRATIYSSGKITMNQSAKVCGSAGCNSEWEPTVNLLAFVAGSSTDEVGFQIRNSGIFQGAIYVVNDYSEENSATVWGPIIGRQLYFQNSTTNHYVPLGTLLPGMPSSSEEVVTLQNETGSWG